MFQLESLFQIYDKICVIIGLINKHIIVYYILGVYDNEVANDWMTSDREVASTLDQFVSSWHIEDGRFD